MELGRLGMAPSIRGYTGNSLPLELRRTLRSFFRETAIPPHEQTSDEKDTGSKTDEYP